MSDDRKGNKKSTCFFLKGGMKACRNQSNIHKSLTSHLSCSPVYLFLNPHESSHSKKKSVSSADCFLDTTQRDSLCSTVHYVIHNNESIKSTPFSIWLSGHLNNHLRYLELIDGYPIIKYLQSIVISVTFTIHGVKPNMSSTTQYR